LAQNLISCSLSLAKPANVSSSRPVDTIDLSDDNENVPANHRAPPQLSAFADSYTRRKGEFHFKKPPPAYVELDDDDDVDQTHFTHSPGFSSTQIIKSKDIDRSPAITGNKAKQPLSSSASSQNRELPQVNSLKEKHSVKDSLKDGHLEKLLDRFNQKHAQKNKTIEEEEKK
jgi:hypothetical protein